MSKVDIKLYHGDCLEVMGGVADKSVDMILCDLPYGIVNQKWDIVIPFDKMWEQYKRIIKDRGAIVLFGTEPFSSKLRCSNLEMFRYDWVWNKNYGTDFQLAKLRPMRTHEIISVFSKSKTANGAKSNMIYYPQKTSLNKPVKNGGVPATKLLHDNKMKKLDNIYTEKSPQTILNFKPVFNTKSNPRLHPTQKPTDLLEYLIKTYTLEGETVMDNCMGSGSTGIACLNTKRNFIGIEKDDHYFEVAKNRIEKAQESIFEVDDPPKIAGRYTQGCRNICEGDCAYAKPVRRAYKDGYNECNAYAKTIIKDLLDNSDEYARQRAEDFLKENK